MKIRADIIIESNELQKGDISFICNAVQEFLNENGIHDYNLRYEVKQDE